MALMVPEKPPTSRFEVWAPLLPCLDGGLHYGPLKSVYGMQCACKRSTVRAHGLNCRPTWSSPGPRCSLGGAVGLLPSMGKAKVPTPLVFAGSEKRDC